MFGLHLPHVIKMKCCNASHVFVFFISIAEVPDAPKQPTVKEVYHDSALISWEPPADGGKPITSYIVERKETMANRYTTHFTPTTG